MSNIKTTTKERCVYCMKDVDVINYTIREIPGYKNHITGNNTAFVEKLSCGHELIDGKFNVDNIYFTNPIVPTKAITPTNHYDSIPTINKEWLAQYEGHQKYQQKRNSINLMDILCLGCLIFLSFVMPPLAILPILYFMFRTR